MIIFSNYFSELWSLINVNDSDSLNINDLEKGMATVTQSEEFFDCLPAVQTAFNFTKLLTNKGVDKDDEVGELVEAEEMKDKETSEGVDNIEVPTRRIEKTLEYGEFQMFLQTLRQYYLFCQVKN